MNTKPEFDLDIHRRVAERVVSGRATAAQVEASQDALLHEVIRLTTLLSPPVAALIPATGIDDLIAALVVVPRNAALYVETGDIRTLAGTVGSYRGYHDHLRVCAGSHKLRTVADVLRWLRGIKRNGFTGDGDVKYEASNGKPIWLAEMDNTSDWVLAGIRIEDDAVILVGNESHGW